MLKKKQIKQTKSPKQLVKASWHAKYFELRQTNMQIFLHIQKKKKKKKTGKVKFYQA